MRVAVLSFLLLAVAPVRVGAEESEVDKAFARGVAWLRKEQKKQDGSFGSGAGETALALLALRHCGVPASDTACTRAAGWLERELPDGTVYGAALGTLALLAQSPERHREEIRKLVDHLIKGQCRNGQWTYAYRQTKRKKAGDNSNTQLAILALAAARTRRVEVPDEVFKRCAAFFVESQNEDGGFGYAHNQRSRSYGSMTAGGAMALALGAAIESGQAFGSASLRERARIGRAFGWLAADFAPDRNRDAGRAFGSKKKKRSDATWRHYWLWSLERACASAGVEKLGKHDWYAEGARYLLDNQSKEGSWRDPEKEIQATCFALLFLARSGQRVLTPRDRDRVTTPK